MCFKKRKQAKEDEKQPEVNFAEQTAVADNPAQSGEIEATLPADSGTGAHCGFNTAVKPGQTVPVSGQYMQVDAKCQPSDTEATLVKGKTVPPTQHSDEQYVLVDATKHKHGK